MTPAELRERRRDRELRKQWLLKIRQLEVARLIETISGIEGIKHDFISLRAEFELAIMLANNRLNSYAAMSKEPQQ